MILTCPVGNVGFEAGPRWGPVDSPPLSPHAQCWRDLTLPMLRPLGSLSMFSAFEPWKRWVGPPR